MGKLQGQGLCGWPLCATRGSRVGLASCLAASAVLAATPSCCAVAFSALCAAAAACSAAAAKSAAGRTGWAARSASLAFTPRAQHLPPPQPHTGNAHAQQARRASSCSLPSSSAHSAVPPRNRQFLRALGKRRSVCSLSEVACRMELSCAPKARIHVLQAPALMTTSLTPQGSERLCLALRQRSSVRVRNSCGKSGVFTPRRMPHIYINK